jgi:capsid assembly protease
MARDLMRVGSQLLNCPLAMHRDKASVIAAVLGGRLNIDALINEHQRIERDEFETIAREARLEADARREERGLNAGGAKEAEPKRGTILEAVGDIAVIQVWGTLTRTWGVGTYSDTTGYDGILMQLEAALADEDIKGIWLDIDSGGGTVNGLFDLVDMIYSFRASNGGPKPIWAMAADYAYSAAYAIGSAADQLFVPPTGGVGSIGVITMHASFREALEKEGIAVTIIREPELKAKASEYEDMDPDTEAQIRAQVREVASIFQGKVARNMGIPKSAVAETKGLDYMGRHAKAIGLVTDVLPEPLAWEKFKRHIARRN